MKRKKKKIIIPVYKANKKKLAGTTVLSLSGTMSFPAEDEWNDCPTVSIKKLE